MTKERRAHAALHIARPIRLRVRIYFLIFLVMAGIVVVDGIRIGGASVLPVLASLVGGVVVGIIASRMFSLSWDHVSGKVVGKLDAVGAVILLAYLAFSIFKTKLLGVWFDGPVLGVAGLAALAGVMAGQVFGTGRGVKRVFTIVIGKAEEPEPAADPA
jgi:hypothetical protein